MLDIKRELAAVDEKNYDFFDQLSEDEKKEFSPYVLLRYVSNVNGDADLQEWFIETVNETVNKNFWALTKNHKSLLWKLYAASGIGSKFFHPYLALGKKEKTDKFEKLLLELYPAAKLDEIKLLAKLMNKDDREKLFEDLGFDKKKKKEYV